MLNQPWECPRCHKINAPWCPQCFCTEPVSSTALEEWPFVIHENAKNMINKSYPRSLIPTQDYEHLKCPICSEYHDHKIPCAKLSSQK